MLKKNSKIIRNEIGSALDERKDSNTDTFQKQNILLPVDTRTKKKKKEKKNENLLSTQIKILEELKNTKKEKITKKATETQDIFSSSSETPSIEKNNERQKKKRRLLERDLTSNPDVLQAMLILRTHPRILQKGAQGNVQTKNSS